MALLEAQACGLPVVAAAVGGVAQIVDHEQTGFLVGPDDVISFAAHLRRLLSDPVRRKEMGVNAEAKCKREHDTTHTAGVLADTFNRLAQ